MRTLLGKRIKDYYFLRDGQQKIVKELDCINLISRLRQLDLLISLFLSNHQKVLLNYSKRNILRKDELESSSSGEEEVNSQYLLKTYDEKKLVLNASTLIKSNI